MPYGSMIHRYLWAGLCMLGFQIWECWGYLEETVLNI